MVPQALRRGRCKQQRPVTSLSRRFPGRPKEIMRVSGQRKIDKIFERLEPPSGTKFTCPRIPAKDLCDFDI